MDGLPERVRIWEVGPRDGLQNESDGHRHGDQDRLHRPTGRCRAAGDRGDELRACRPDPAARRRGRGHGRHRARPGVRYPVLVPNRRGLDAALARGCPRHRGLRQCDRDVRRAQPRTHAGDADGDVRPSARARRRRGHPVRGYVSMCFGDPWEGAVDPQQVVDVCVELHRARLQRRQSRRHHRRRDSRPGAHADRAAGVGGIQIDSLGVHFHDTYGQALSNTLAALQCGVTTVDSSAGGIGGCPYAESATGNLATEDVIWMLDGLGDRDRRRPGGARGDDLGGWRATWGGRCSPAWGRRSGRTRRPPERS